MDYASEIIDLIFKGRSSEALAFDYYQKAGALLLDKKRQLESEGNSFPAWVRLNITSKENGLSLATCYDYVRLAENSVELESYRRLEPSPSINGAKKHLRKKFGTEGERKVAEQDDELLHMNNLLSALPDNSSLYLTLTNKSKLIRKFLEQPRERTSQVVKVAVDSGAYSFAKDQPEGFFDCESYRNYLDDYAWFIKRHESELEFYANLDVIGNPKRSHVNLMYLESLGLRPMPVIHLGTDPNWLDYYVDRYSRIGFGGLANAKRSEYEPWLNECFAYIKDCYTEPDTVVHGFGVGSYRKLISYPWASVDHTSWLTKAYHGTILIPDCSSGKAEFNNRPMDFNVTTDASNVDLCKRAETWLSLIGISMLEVQDYYQKRRLANLAYYEGLRKARLGDMVMYYSGSFSIEDYPPNTLLDGAGILPSYYKLQETAKSTVTSKFTELLQSVGKTFNNRI